MVCNASRTPEGGILELASESRHGRSPQRALLSASTSRRTLSAETKAPASSWRAGAVRPSSKWSGRTVQVGFAMRFSGRLRSILRSPCRPDARLQRERGPLYAIVNVRMASYPRRRPKVAGATGAGAGLYTPHPGDRIEVWRKPLRAKGS